MSDVTVAPPGGAPSAAPNEVVINETPTTTPTPIGQQAPDKPEADRRREAIQKAFDRANDPTSAKDPERPKPKPAEAKAGHNRPPEETPQEKPQEKPQRGDGGRFAPRESVQGNAGQSRANEANAQRLPETAPYREPPPRMRDQAKAEWHAAPESVRGEVHRMHQEFGEAYRQYREDNETMNSIRHFHQLAQEHGTTLDRALHNYVSMEQKLRSDVVGGLDVIVNNLGLQTPDGERLTLRDVAYHILNQSPEQHRLVQQQNVQQAANMQIGALHQELAGLKQALHQWQTAQQFTYTRSAVDQFADQHPRFDELGDLIEHELTLGFDLESAYRRAELLRPTTQAAQTRTPSAQTRNIDRSISGSPDGPSNGTGRRPEKPVGRREAIQNAIRRVNGGL